MVAVVVGSRLGLEQTSAWVLGSRGQLGSAALGRAGENVFVNAATGNLILNNRDEFLIGQGGDATIGRTYNSKGALNDDNGDNWQSGVTRQVYGLMGVVNTAGSYLSHLDWDGSSAVYHWDSAKSAYVSREGGGAFDTITYSGVTWSRTDGDTGVVETYGPDQSFQIGTSRDRDGNTTTYSYNGAGRVSRVTTADGSYTDLTWSGANLTQLTTTYYDGPTSSWKSLTRVRYGYDGSNRLTTVTVDLSPNDNTIADGRTYVTTYTYDGASKRVASISQTDGSRVDIAYETGGAYRVTSISQSVAEGVTRVTRFSYVSATRTDVIDADGGVTRMEFDAAGQLTRITEPEPTAGAPAPVQEFIYTADGDLFRIKTGPDSWTDFFYPPGGSSGVWTSRYERTGAGYITTQRTYNAANSILTETRYETLDLDDGGAAYQPSGPMTTRYAYDNENHLRFVVSATGAVTRYDYSTNGNLIRSTAFTGVRYNLAGLAVGDTIAESSLHAWASALTDKTAAQITETVYDFRGNVAQTVAYSTVLATGVGDGGSPITVTNYIYDQAGQLLSRHAVGASNAETFIYDGLGRTVSAVDFNGAATTTAFHDALGTTVVRLANGLNQVSVYNKAGEVVSYSESERGANLVNLQGWPEYDPNLPAGYAAQPAWPAHYNGETRWQTNIGPDGQPVTTMQAGQTGLGGAAGGGSHSNMVAVDRSKSYEFTYYFRRDNSDHAVWFGLGGGVVEAFDGVAVDNPYFSVFGTDGISWVGPTHTPVVAGPWYKVVAHVLAEGSTTSPYAATGVYNLETGQKVAEVANYRWRANPTTNETYSRFFDYYSENEVGFSTQFYKPEIRRMDQPSVNLINLSGWPGPAEPPSGPATMPGWLNNYQTEETRWQYIDGPDGRQVAAIHAGQYDAWNSGGGQYTNQFTVDGNKDYEFVYYFRKNDLDSHIVFFGLSGSDPAYVRNAGGDGSVNTNPYFVYFNSNGYSYNTTTYQPIQEDRWYKVVGHVYAQGSTNASSSATGVFDAETGQKMADVANFRWDAARPNNSVHSRFFTYYEEAEVGFSTYFYKPEVHSFDQPSVNLIDLSGWAPPPPNSGSAAVEGWLNWSNEDTRWHVVDGPEGRKVVAIQAGQLDAYQHGGGNYTNEATIDGSKAYEFTLYMRKEDLTKHNVYFGLSSNWETPPRPYVDNATYGGGDQNPYFYGSNPSMQQASLVEDRWYKVVGYVLPEGSANVAAGSLGGVFDTTTGVKVADVNNFRWRADRPGSQIHARFFDYYDETKLGWSTSFYKPEIREVSTSAVEALLPAPSTQYRYDKLGRLRMSTDPTGRSSHFIFDNAGRKTGEVDADGSLTEYKYDLTDRLVATVRYATRLTAADIASLVDGMGNPVPTETAWIRPNAHADDSWSWNVYDGAGRLVQTIDAAGGSTAYEYDGASRLVKTTARATAFTAGQIAAFRSTPPLTVQTPGDSGADRITRYFFDADGRQIGTLDAEGNLSRIVYDAAGRAIQTSAYANGTAQVLRATGTFQQLYDSFSKDSAVDIHTWSVYDGRGFLKGTVNGEGEVVLYDYTPLGYSSQVQTGRKLASVPTSQPTLAQLVAAPASPVLETTSYTRNPLGQVLTETRALASGSEVITYTYDSLHRLTGQSVNRVTGADYENRQRYDRRGRLIGQLSGEGSAALAALGGSPTKAQVDAVYRKWGTTFAYDAADRMISRTEPDGIDGAGFTTFYFYDADGALAYEVNALGEVQGHVYDAQNRRIHTIAYGSRIATAGLKGGNVIGALPSRTSITSADSRTVLVYNTRDLVAASVDALGRATGYGFNAFGELTSLHQTSGLPGSADEALTFYGRDRRGQVTTLTDSLNQVAYTAYDAFGRAIQETDARGVARSTLYDRAGRTKVVKDAFNNQTAYAYDARGHVITVTDRLGKVTTLTRDAFGRQTTITTAKGLVTTTTFDDQGHALSVTDGAGRNTSYAYDLDGQLKTVTNGLGQQDVNTYDPAGRLYETTDAAGVKVRYGYDGAGRVLTETVDPTGLNLVTTHVYDAKGQRIRVTDPAGVRTDYVFDAAGRTVETIVDPAGLALRTQFAYDRAGNLLTLGEAVGTSAERFTTYIYDKLGRLTYQQTGDASLNIRAMYDYDANGNVVRKRDGVTASDNTLVRYVYDPENRLILTVDAVGAVTRNEYDAEGRVVRTTGYVNTVSLWQDILTESLVMGALGSSPAQRTDYVYDDDGRLVFTRNAAGQVTELAYDGAGHVVRRTDYANTYVTGTIPTEAELRGWLAVYGSASDRTSLAAYDAAGRQTYAIDAAGQVTAFAYDGAGRVIRARQHAVLNTANGVMSHATLEGWAASNANASDRVTRTAYDAAGRAVFVIDAEGYVSRTVYNAAGNVTGQSRFAPVVSVSDGVSAATVASLVAAHESTAATTAYSYDAGGRRKSIIDANGVQTLFEIDGRGRITHEYRAFATTDQTFVWRSYDDGDRLIDQVEAVGEAEQRVLSWTYDGLGRMLTSTDGVGQPTVRTYDAMGRVLTVTVQISASQSAVTINTYDAFGNLAKVVDPRGNAGFFYYDSLNRLTLQVDPEGYATQTTYGVGGEIATVTRRAAKVSGTPTVQTPPTIVTGAGDAVTTIVRDKLDRIVATTDAQGYTESYQLNAFGDRTTVTNKLGGQTHYTYDKRGLMLSEQLPITSLQTGGVMANVVNQFQYDARGNLTRTIEAAGLGEARTTHYVYDKLDRLIQKSGDAVTVTSSVDFSTTTVTPTEHIVYDRRGNVIETRDAAGARTLFYYDDNNRKIAEIDALGALKTWVYDDNNNATVARAYDTPVALPGAPGGTPPAGSGNYRETLNTYDRNNRLTHTSVQGLRFGELGSTYATSSVAAVTRMDYDAAGNVIRVVDGRGETTYAFYDALGRQIAAVDAEGYLTTWVRDAEGNVTREVRYGVRVSGALDTGANPAPPAPPRAADASLGDRITDFTYDRNGRRLAEVRRGVAVYSAGAPDRLTVADSSITYAYDGLGNVVIKVEANGDYVEYGYDLLGRQTTATKSAIVDFQGLVSRRRTATMYNGWSAVTKIEDGEQSAPAAQNRVTFFSYGAGGRLGATTDATGFVRQFGHDAAGRVVHEFYNRQRGDGVTVIEGHRYVYDLKGQITSEGSASFSGAWNFGDTRTTAYNAHGEITAKGVNGLWQERFVYDNAGRLHSSTGGDGVLRMYLYDRAGRNTVVAVSTGADFAHYTSNDFVWVLTNGNTVGLGSQSDLPGFAITINTYDRRGLLTGTREPHRQLSRDLTTGAYTTATLVRDRTYNAFGEVVSETDARGGVTDFTYNTMGRIIETRRPTVAFTDEHGVVSSARPTEQSRYDVSGRLVATRTANGYWTSRTLLAGSGHNGEEALAVTTFNADGGVLSNYYDVFGDLRVAVDGLGHQTAMNYDKAGRLTVTYHALRAAWTAGNPTGAAVQMYDVYGYDGLGQRISHWNGQFGAGYQERTIYDREGRVVSQTDFEGRATTYSYVWDTSLTTTGLGTFGGWIKTTWNPSSTASVERTDYFGRVTARTDLGGRTYAMGFDKGGRLVSQTSSAGQYLTWGWYNTGLAAEQQDLITGAMGHFSYDAAGNRLSERYVAAGALRQDAYAQYDALGRMTEFRDTTASWSDPTRTLWTYDLNGNVRSTQTNYRQVDAAPGSPTFATSTMWNRYDGMDRMVHVEGNLSDGEIRLGRRLEYDAAGNRVRMLTEMPVQTDIENGGTWVWVPDPNTGGGDHEVIIDPEDPGSGHYEYHATYESRPGWVVEHYDYTADGYLARVGKSRSEWNTYTDTVVMGATTWFSEDVRDAMGRLTMRTETNGERAGVTTSYSRQATYDKTGLITWEQTYTYIRDDVFTNTTARFNTSTTTYNYFEGSTWRGVVTSVTTAGYTDPWPQGGSTTPVAGTRTDYAYSWWDDARQSSITYDSDTGSGSNGLHTSSFSYDVNGRVSSVYIADARPRTVTFVTDAQGQVLLRSEADYTSYADPIDRYFYFNGQRIGQTTNNVQWGTNYYGEMYNRGWVGPTTPTPFRGGNYAQHGVDFDLAYEALTPSSVRATGQAWTVRDGDTLQGMAAAVWGDASLWYLIAEANGLTSASILTAGQILTIPPKAGNVHNNSETFRPYDPNEALGNLNPTQPKPPKKGGGCGVVGQIILVAIAVAVAAIIAPYAIAAVANAGAAAGAATVTAASVQTAITAGTLTSSFGAGALVGGGAIAGAAGSIASQAVGVATGIQEKFDWKGVALSALSSAVSAGLGSVMKVAKGASATFEAIKRGALGSVITQGVAVATGLQDSFSWTSVAVSAVSAGVGQAAGSHLPSHYTAEQAGFVSGLAGSVAGAATQSVIDGTSFGDNLIATLPGVIGNTIGNMVAGGVQARSSTGSKTGSMSESLSEGHGSWAPKLGTYGMAYGGEDALSATDFGMNASAIVADGQPTARRSLLQKVGGFFRDPIGSIGRGIDSVRRVLAPRIDYTRESVGATYAALSNEVTELEEVVVDGVRQARNSVRQTWTDFSQAWSVQPQRPRGGETFFSAPPPSNPVTWVNGDIGLRRAAVRDMLAHANGLDAMRSVTNPGAMNFGLTVRAHLERSHGGFANQFAVPFGVIDTVMGRPAEAVGLRWNSPENVTGHMMAEPAIMVGSVFIGNPQAIAGGLGPKAISIGRAEVLAAESAGVRGSAAARSEAAANIREARQILAETRPDLPVGERNQIIRAFELETFRVERLTAPTSEFRYFDGLDGGAGLAGRWSTSEWLSSPADRISRLALPGNQATRAAEVILQPGTTVFRGTVAPQPRFGPHLVGGSPQSYNAAGPYAVFREIP